MMTSDAKMPRSPSVKWLSVFVGALLLVVAILLWHLTFRQFQTPRTHLATDATNSQSALHLRLESNRDYLLLLATEMVRGALNAATFQERTAQYVADHPELINVTWADADFVIRWTAPFAPNKQVIGLTLSLPEPARASRLAYTTRQPAYTKPFVIIQGKIAFEIYVPVFRGETFLGTFGGVYVAEDVLRHAISPSIAHRYALSLHTVDDTLLAQLATGAPLDSRLTQRVALTPPGHGMALRLTPYARQTSWGVWGLAIITICLAFVVIYGLWALDRHTAWRRQTEATLRESEQRFRDLIEGSIQGVVVHRDFIPLFANQAFADIHGYGTPADILALDSLHCLLAPHEHDQLVHNYETRMQGGDAPGEYAYQGLRSDGSPIWLDSVVRVITWEGEAAVQSTVVDITTRKQTEEALRYQRDWLNVTLSSIGDAVIATDTTGTITFINPVAATLTEWTVADAMGRPIDEVFDIINEQSLQPVDNPVTRVLEEGTVVGVTNHTLLMTRTGREVAIAASGAPIFDSSRQLYGVVVVFRDITESQHLEEQMQQAQKMQAIGTLAGGIAHEFNNILGVMLGYADLTQYEVSQGSKAWKNLQRILLAGRRAKDLVQQLLAFSRQGTLELESLSFPLLIKEALALLRSTLPSTLEVHTSIDETVGTVLADRTQLHQIVMNLCANAEYAMRGEAGGILEVRVETMEVNAANAAHYPNLRLGPYVKLSVCDTGQGMAPSVQAHIFEPFFTTKDVGEGTGMGLAIVHGIVTNYGGDITVESTPGQGTTVSIYLPQVAATPTPASHAADATLPQGTERILVVDDEATLVQAVEAMLTHLGYDVVACTESLTALETFRATPERFDLVMMDQTMPEMTGETLMRELRSIRSDIPVILCTGFSHVIDDARARALGVDAFLMKPVVLKDVALAVRRVFAQQS